jgi:hypothetical protein
MCATATDKPNHLDSGWSSMRNSDDTPLVLNFDYYDDHSSWRLDDLQESINEAIQIFAGSETPMTVETLNDLKPLVKALRELHRNTQVHDSVIRRALVLADELELSDDIESFDSSFEYDSAIDHLIEVLEAWDEAHNWIWTAEDWNVTATQQLEIIRRNRRDGLGERWTIKISDGLVELPGVDVNGYNPDKETTSLFDSLTALVYDEPTLGSIANKLEKLEFSIVPLLQEFADSYERADIEVDIPTLDNMIVAASNMNIDDIDKVVHTIEALAEDWYDGPETLIKTAAALLSTQEQ